MSNQSVYSDYFGRSFNSTEIGTALTFYLEWCNANRLLPEVSGLDEIDESNIDHVLYHAEIQGFQTEEE